MPPELAMWQLHLLLGLMFQPDSVILPKSLPVHMHAYCTGLSPDCAFHLAAMQSN